MELVNLVCAGDVQGAQIRIKGSTGEIVADEIVKKKKKRKKEWRVGITQINTSSSLCAHKKLFSCSFLQNVKRSYLHKQLFNSENWSCVLSALEIIYYQQLIAMKETTQSVYSLKISLA